MFSPGIPVVVFLKEAHRFNKGYLPHEHDHVYRIIILPAAKTPPQVCFRVNGGVEVAAERAQEAEMAF